MATRNKREPAALNKENCEEHPRIILAENSNVPRSQEDYITQVSAEIEGRVTKKLSQDFSSTENRRLGALARLNDFLKNPLTQGHCGTTPEAPRNMFGINQGTNEDESQSDPHPDAGSFNSGRDHDMVTGVHEEVTYCSPLQIQESRKRTAPQINRNFAAETPLRQLRHTNFCWHFSS